MIPVIQQPISFSKRCVFWSILFATPLLFIMLCVEAYYLYAYVSFPGYYCGSFSKLDREIGWVLKENSKSCIGGKESAFGDTAFEEPVFTNSLGIRVSKPESKITTSITEKIIGIGDSWTFGYGVKYEDSFMGKLESHYNIPTSTVSSPAYSGIQALLLADRLISPSNNQTFTYLERGFWRRGVCSGPNRPANVLKPCYWVSPLKQVEIITPQVEHFTNATKFGIYPGGMVGAGEKTLSYFLISRPVHKFSQMLVRAGLKSGFADDFHAWGNEDDLRLIRKAHLLNLITLATDKKAKLLLIDGKK